MIRDRKYLDALRDEPCLITGLKLPYDPVEPVHIGTAGKGLKSSDDEAWVESEVANATGNPDLAKAKREALVAAHKRVREGQ